MQQVVSTHASTRVNITTLQLYTCENSLLEMGIREIAIRTGWHSEACMQGLQSKSWEHLDFGRPASNHNVGLSHIAKLQSPDSVPDRSNC
jgi:hypothetical protein